MRRIGIDKIIPIFQLRVKKRKRIGYKAKARKSAPKSALREFKRINGSDPADQTARSFSGTERAE